MFYIINFLYWFFSTFELFLLKIITYNYNINSIIFNSTFRAIILPYYIYKIFTHKKGNKISSAKWYDITIGVLDQLDIILTYISLVGLYIIEYINFRSLSIFFAGLYSMLYYKKLLSGQKLISISFIVLSSLILLFFSSSTNIYYSFVCILSSLLYSLVSLIIEVNIKDKNELFLNLYWLKTISYLIALFIGLVSEINYKSISSILYKFSLKNIIIIVFLEICIAILENYYYLYKIKVISQYELNGSVIVQFIDIVRRFTLIILGTIFFNENYNTIFYISMSLMFIGSIYGLINMENIYFYYNKYFAKKNINVSNEIIIVNV